MIIDATDLILGRLAAVAAKKALLGESVIVVNCEKAVISGVRRQIVQAYLTKTHRKTVAHGPYFPRMPDRLVRRTIRGMLPYKKEKGEKAFKRVMCYIGVPKEFQGKSESLKSASIYERQITKYVTLADICKELGALL